MSPAAGRGRRWPDRRRLAGVALALPLALLGAGPGFAADSKGGGRPTDAATGEVAERQSDLKSLRNQIDALRREMTAAEGSRREAADQLQEAERSISSTQRELQQLTIQIGNYQAALRSLDAESRELEQRLNAQQSQLERLLYRQYLRGNPDPLRLLLNGEDPNQSARDLHYFEAIGRARRQLLRDVQSTWQRKQALAGEARQQAEQLAATESRRQEEHARLLAQRAQRQATLDRVADQIATQRREIGNLQRDEKRLTELIDRLSKVIAARAAEAREAARREALRREAAKPEERHERPSRPGTQAPDAERPGKALAASPALASPAAPPTGHLARPRGEAQLPTRGTVIHRYGTPRQEGSTWKGIFIRAATGSEVRSVASGRVVFAEWMRGFGNLLIVDHGNSYLSIYANNDSLLKQVGEEVGAGEALATVGNSGGNPDSGLYFEIRHQGRPLDPLAWLNLK
ncbi:peptidoglycan DD-metalloendopeptidase family protein [Accumulibacter sp.]|uniref:murein hydrolase activator EnvC family protein n=1 Tax=Accumulibacter sp. TaxID=2053492 RepID=UPI002612DD6C|nr:peptidoglycan DD-metalloendopeptidase family protein [Accumulibacter sp.]